MTEVAPAQATQVDATNEKAAATAAPAAAPAAAEAAVTDGVKPNTEIPAGYAGNLTEEQEGKLREMWKRFIDLCQAEAKSDAPAGPKHGLDDWDGKNDGKGSGIPKDDKAKEKLKAETESKEMQAMLNDYGGAKFRETFWKFNRLDNPDGSMLRFLRARKWDVDRAIAMLATCMRWRIDVDADGIVQKGEYGMRDVKGFLAQMDTGKTYTFGATKDDYPICYIHVKDHDIFGQPGSSMQKYVIFAQESFRATMVPPNDKIVLVFDLTGFGLRNMDWNCILFIVKSLEAFYPESLGTLYIHKAPWIFWAIWKILGPLLDPVVRAKVSFTKTPADLEKQIPADRLIDRLGGNCTYKFEYIQPDPEENKLQEDTATTEKLQKQYFDLATEYEEATKEWVAADGKEGKDKRINIARKLRLLQFELDLYTRGRTIYHRRHVFDNKGLVHWEYEQKDGKKFEHVVGQGHDVDSLKAQIAAYDAQTKQG